MDKAAVIKSINEAMRLIGLSADQVIVGGDTALLLMGVRTEEVEQVNLWIPVPHWQDQWRWLCETLSSRMGDYIQWAEDTRLYKGFIDTNVQAVDGIYCYGPDLLTWQLQLFNGDLNNTREENVQRYSDLSNLSAYIKEHNYATRRYPGKC